MMGWMPLKARRNFARLCLWFKLLAMDHERLVRKIYLASAKNFEAKGTKNWAGGVAETLRKLGLGWMWEERWCTA